MTTRLRPGDTIETPWGTLAVHGCKDWNNTDGGDGKATPSGSWLSTVDDEGRPHIVRFTKGQWERDL